MATRTPRSAPRRPPRQPGSPRVGATAERRRLPVLLRRAWFGLNQAFRRRLAHLELTPDQYTVLRTLSEQAAAGLTQRELTGLMASDPNTVAALLERMEQASLVERRPDLQDGRANRVHLTATGADRFGAARTVAAALQDEVLATLPGAQRGAFLEQLERLALACQRALAPPPRSRA